MTAPKTETEKNLFNDDLKNFLKIEPISETSKRDEVPKKLFLIVINVIECHQLYDTDA